MRRVIGIVMALGAICGTVTPALAEVRIGLGLPLTGHYAWNGASNQNGLDQAVADLNAAGGVLGQPVEVVLADDYCDGEQALAAARKLVAERVSVVFGHQCSAAALPASELYHQAGVLFISIGATNPRLTDRRLWNVFRVAGRDDQQAELWVGTLAANWTGKRIAIVYDTTVWARGLVDEVKKRLAERGAMDVRFEQIEPGRAEYGDLAAGLAADKVDVVCLALYTQEAGLLARQLHEAGSLAQIILGDSAQTEDFARLAGPAADGVLMSQVPQVKILPSAQALIARLDRGMVERNEFGFRTYVAVQAWAEAVRRAGTLDPAAVARELKAGRFATVMGEIGFDEKGDPTGATDMVWHVWQGGTWRARR
jgi:branched-chain amino acid transport system substrate-binding protein